MMTEPSRVRMDPSWLSLLADCFEHQTMQALRVFLRQEKQLHAVYPPGNLIFNAFTLTPVDQVKVIVLGQDPYHGVGQAMGLSFSVPTGVPPPPSLQNIHKEMLSDLGIRQPDTHGDLTSWARQGVLMLNAVLTVRANQASSHAGQGWEWFTDQVIFRIAQHKSPLVFLLWGRAAQQKVAHINTDQHCVIRSSHPSPFSAHQGFLGSKPFSRTNDFLQAHGISPIDWQL